MKLRNYTYPVLVALFVLGLPPAKTTSQIQRDDEKYCWPNTLVSTIRGFSTASGIYYIEIKRNW